MKKVIVVFGLCCTAILLAGSPAMAADDPDPCEVVPNISTYEALTNVQNFDNAFILDIRTPQEWIWVGHPGPIKINELDPYYWLLGKVKQVSYFLTPWIKPPTPNPSFISDVDEIVDENFEGDIGVKIYVLCRSGKRGIPATVALCKAGYRNAKNIQYGFEGPTDSDGHRTVDGWKINWLPYNHSPAGRYLD